MIAGIDVQHYQNVSVKQTPSGTSKLEQPVPGSKIVICAEILVSQGAKKIIFTACHLGKLKLAFTSADIISASPKIFLTGRIDFTVLLLFEFLKKHHLPIGQVKNRIH